MGEDKEIFKIKKDLPEKSLISLYVVILERIKDNERLIKEHSMQINNLHQIIRLKFPNLFGAFLTLGGSLLSPSSTIYHSNYL